MIRHYSQDNVTWIHPNKRFNNRVLNTGFESKLLTFELPQFLNEKKQINKKYKQFLSQR